MRLDGKRIILTGAASGIGRATANRITGEGALVAMLDIAEDAGVRLAGELGHLKPVSGTQTSPTKRR
jgi:NAD(P)-dependent dehydrogenase (short-subunit alcohol dehydrogenase family)